MIKMWNLWESHGKSYLCWSSVMSWWWFVDHNIQHVFQCHWATGPWSYGLGPGASMVRGLSFSAWWWKNGQNAPCLGRKEANFNWLVVSNMNGLFSMSYMGCHPSHRRTPSFFKIVKTANQNGIRTEYNRNTDNPLVVKKIGSQWEMNSKWDILSRVWLGEDHIKIAGRCW